MQKPPPAPGQASAGAGRWSAETRVSPAATPPRRGSPSPSSEEVELISAAHSLQRAVHEAAAVLLTRSEDEAAAAFRERSAGQRAARQASADRVAAEAALAEVQLQQRQVDSLRKMLVHRLAEASSQLLQPRPGRSPGQPPMAHRTGDFAASHSLARAAQDNASALLELLGGQATPPHRPPWGSANTPQVAADHAGFVGALVARLRSPPRRAGLGGGTVVSTPDGDIEVSESADRTRPRPQKPAGAVPTRSVENRTLSSTPAEVEVEEAEPNSAAAARAFHAQTGEPVITVLLPRRPTRVQLRQAQQDLKEYTRHVTARLRALQSVGDAARRRMAFHGDERDTSHFRATTSGLDVDSDDGSSEEGDWVPPPEPHSPSRQHTSPAHQLSSRSAAHRLPPHQRQPTPSPAPVLPALHGSGAGFPAVANTLLRLRTLQESPVQEQTPPQTREGAASEDPDTSAEPSLSAAAPQVHAEPPMPERQHSSLPLQRSTSQKAALQQVFRPAFNLPKYQQAKHDERCQTLLSSSLRGLALATAAASAKGAPPPALRNYNAGKDSQSAAGAARHAQHIEAGAAGLAQPLPAPPPLPSQVPLPQSEQVAPSPILAAEPTATQRAMPPVPETTPQDDPRTGTEAPMAPAKPWYTLPPGREVSEESDAFTPPMRGVSDGSGSGLGSPRTRGRTVSNLTQEQLDHDWLGPDGVIMGPVQTPKASADGAKRKTSVRWAETPPITEDTPPADAPLPASAMQAETPTVHAPAPVPAAGGADTSSSASQATPHKPGVAARVAAWFGRKPASDTAAPPKPATPPPAAAASPAPAPKSKSLWGGIRGVFGMAGGGGGGSSTKAQAEGVPLGSAPTIQKEAWYPRWRQEWEGTGDFQRYTGNAAPELAVPLPFKPLHVGHDTAPAGMGPPSPGATPAAAALSPRLGTRAYSTPTTHLMKMLKEGDGWGHSTPHASTYYDGGVDDLEDSTLLSQVQALRPSERRRNLAADEAAAGVRLDLLTPPSGKSTAGAALQWQGAAMSAREAGQRSAEASLANDPVARDDPSLPSPARSPRGNLQGFAL